MKENKKNLSLKIIIITLILVTVTVYVINISQRTNEKNEANIITDAQNKNIPLDKIEVKTEIAKADLNFNSELQKAKEKYNNNLNSLSTGCYKSIEDVTKKDCETEIAQSIKDEFTFTESYYKEILESTNNYKTSINEWATKGLFTVEKSELEMINSSFDKIIFLLNEKFTSERNKFQVIIEYNDFLIKNQSEIEIVNHQIHFSSTELQKKLEELITKNLAAVKNNEEKQKNLSDELTVQINQLKNYLN